MICGRFGAWSIVFGCGCLQPLIALLAVGLTGLAVAEESAPFRVPPGFRLERMADQQLIPDASCLTLDPAGRPVVAGPGYIRTLLPASFSAVDSSAADLADAAAGQAHPPSAAYVRAVDWLAGWPTQAAHGLHREGDHLYCVADGGLWRSTADAGRLQASSSPQRLLTLKTGGEHDAHAIRRGPDGWWYLLAGNMATGIERLLNDPDSPVLEPRAGTLWRISPDWSRRTVWAHGLRNAYGFDFLPDGRPVTFDSDGERDISLPWYRPTRVLLLNAGSDAGFVTRAWKDADHRPTMPTVLARLGRGSPTGVCYYDHPHFPPAYRRKIIVLDWTFGRVLAVDPWGPGDRETSVEVLVEPAGMVGFAPTAVVVEPSGSLLISVGGRGTRGGLYRLSYEAGDELSSVSPTFGATPADQASTVEAPAVPNDPPGSLRQAQQLVAAGRKLPAASIDFLLNDPDLHRQSAAWYLLGRQAVEATPEQWNRWRELALPSIDRRSESAAPSGGSVSQVPPRDRTTELSRMALELEARGLLRWPIGDWTLEGPMLDGENVAVLAQLRQLELWCRWRQAEATGHHASGAAAIKAGASWSDALAGGLYATVQQRERWTDEMPWLARLDPSQPPLGRQQAVEQLTGLQLALGDLRWELPGLSFVERPPSVFDGYRGCSELGWSEAQRRRWLSWLQACGKLAEERGWDGVLEEVVRTVAMLGLLSDADGDWVAGWLSQDRPPSFQVLCMLALASGSAQLSTRCQEQLAEAWLGLGDSLRSWDAQVDHHWEPRLLELFEALLVRAPSLATLVVEHPSFATQDQTYGLVVAVARTFEVPRQGSDAAAAAR
jgi:glucose/arabinose dehydrogenase